LPVDEGSAKVRLFVGVRISVAAAEAIAKAAEALRQASAARGLKPRWVTPTNYHITLKFLGWAHAPTIGVVGDAIGEALAGAAAFEVESAGLGAFPRPERARVLWAGTRDPDGRLADLAARVDRATAELGFAREARAFHAHVTIARLKQPADASQLLEAASEQEFRKSWIDSVVLFESEMKSAGSEYRPRAFWSLDRPESGAGRQT
jgi:RNA 2',3'-cyclic 3'-phosphodiesterase